MKNGSAPYFCCVFVLNWVFFFICILLIYLFFSIFFMFGGSGVVTGVDFLLLLFVGVFFQIQFVGCRFKIKVCRNLKMIFFF